MISFYEEVNYKEENFHKHPQILMKVSKTDVKNMKVMAYL